MYYLIIESKLINDICMNLIIFEIFNEERIFRFLYIVFLKLYNGINFIVFYFLFFIIFVVNCIV